MREALHIFWDACVIPQLQSMAVVVVRDFPMCEATFADVKHDVAQRFEIYVAGIELANGGQELRDTTIARNRLRDDCLQRTLQGKAIPPVDIALMETAAHLPPLSGIALGVDRLTMLTLDQRTLDGISRFPAGHYSQI